MGKTGGVSLALRNLFFTIIVPGTAAIYVPSLILNGSGADPAPMAWPAAVVISLGAGLYAWVRRGLRDRRSGNACSLGRTAPLRRRGALPLGP